MMILGPRVYSTGRLMRGRLQDRDAVNQNFFDDGKSSLDTERLASRRIEADRASGFDSPPWAEYPVISCTAKLAGRCGGCWESRLCVRCCVQMRFFSSTLNIFRDTLIEVRRGRFLKWHENDTCQSYNELFHFLAVKFSSEYLFAVIFIIYLN